MAITPDTKDWTWVLERTCPECGFDSGSVAREDVGAILRDNGSSWVAEVLPRPDVRERPDDSTWSPLEYACHVRDVFRLYAFRLDLMLVQDDPDFPNWDQDETAITDRYAEQDPGTVSTQLSEAAGVLADGFDRVQGDQWERTGNRSDGARFTVDTFARYLAHDPVHHLQDVRRTAGS